jgi:predicted nucleic acid-binding protein
VVRFVIDPATLLKVARSSSPINPANQLVAPNSIRSEALDLLLADVREGRISDDTARALLEKITEVKIRLLGDRVSRQSAWKLAVEHDWATIHDAEYLAVAKLQADALIASDPTLAERAVGIIPIASFDDLFSGEAPVLR